MLRRLIAKAAQTYKGEDYRIDPLLDSRTLLVFSLRRVLCLVRCVVRGIRFSLNPTHLIFVSARVKLHNRRHIRLGHGVTLGEGVLIDGLSRKGIEIGDSVSIGAYTIIRATGSLSDIGEGFRIGARSSLGEFSYVGAAGGVWIGEDVIMGQKVNFHAENHNIDRTDIPIRNQGVNRQGITIEGDCWIGASVVFLDGAYIGKGCVIGAGAVVKGHIPAYSVAVGVPARVIRGRL